MSEHYPNIHDKMKLCCGPFCAECVAVMEHANATLAARDAEVAGLKAEVERLRAESDGWRDKWARSDEGSEILQQHLADARADIEILMEAIDQQITATIGPAILTNMDEAAQNEIRLRIERLEEARQRTHTWKQDEATIEAAEALAKKGEASNEQ